MRAPDIDQAAGDKPAAVICSHQMSDLVRLLLALVLFSGIAGPALAQPGERSIDFAGWSWTVRRSNGLEGPGPNRFLDNQRTVWLDDQEHLHLKVWMRNNRAYTAEVVLDQSLGYGTYIVESIGRVDDMDPPVVFAIFTYDDSPLYDHREIDIEYGRFGDAAGPNAQFVVQPFENDENRHRYEMEQEGDHLTHVIQWEPDSVRFATIHGHVADIIVRDGYPAAAGLSSAEGVSRAATANPTATVKPVATVNPAATVNAAAVWEYRGEVPPPGDERFRINLWLYEGALPTRDHEVVISSFSFVPAKGVTGD